MSSSDAFDAFDAAAPWLPTAWPAWSESAADYPVAAADDGFVAGWSADAAPPARLTAMPRAARPSDAADAADGATPADVLGALLPDLTGLIARAGWDTDDKAWADLVAAAADEREAQVRSELAEGHAGDVADRETAHAAALEAAWDDGHAAGREAGGADARAELATAAGVLDGAVEQVRAHEARWMGDLRAHVAALAVAVARHVIEREVAADASLVLTLAGGAVAEFPADEPLVVRVHPDDLAALKPAWDAGVRAGAVRWAPDARVARGGVLAEGRERIVDGRVDAALERVYRALAGHAA